MARIDDLIDEEINRQTYVAECLILLRNILSTGDCNDCAKKNECKYAPKPGQIVRYNCPFYEAEKEVSK